MIRDIFQYIWICIRYSIKPSWDLAVGFFGSLLVAYFSGWFETLFDSIEYIKSNENIKSVSFMLLAAIFAFLVVFIVRLLIISPFILWRSQKHELTKLNADERNGVFDWSSKETAEYIMSELNYDMMSANEFIREMVIEERIHIRAFSLGDKIQTEVNNKIFSRLNSHNYAVIHLVGTYDEKVDKAEWDLPYHENGWIDKKFNDKFNETPLFVSPRFRSSQVISVVEWYKKSQ